MNKKGFSLLFSLLLCSVFSLQGQTQTPFEKGDGNYNATYQEAIDFYKSLEAASEMVQVKEYKNGTDAGLPMHLVVISGDGKSFHPAQMRKQEKLILLINNGIHPGEPCGVDASMILARDLVTDKIYKPLMDHIAVLIIPEYNVGGALNRGPYSRANQNGPSDHGFRGNARLLDLNRDFIKTDSRNARSFLEIFAEWKPDLFVDTHTSNGADYPYTMTYIPTQKDKLGGELAKYMETVLNPEMLKAMEKASYEMCPYVQTMGWQMPPDSGLVGFLETARYSTGLAALFNTIGYTTEAHMLKPYKDRVYGTYHFLLNLMKTANRDRKIISRLRKAAKTEVKSREEFTIRWRLDPKQATTIPFRGFAAKTITSEVTGMPRLIYDRDDVWRKDIRHFNTYVPEITVKRPEAYLVPQAWKEVVERLKLAGVAMQALSADTDVEVETYYIEDFKAASQPYEGHWPLSNIKVRKETQTLTYRKGDYLIYCNQPANRYIIETLEPQAHDSWMSWNFFDEILQRKEYFSPYIFEKTAKNLLAADPDLKKRFDEVIKSDSTLMGNDYGQMDFIYRNSPFYEPTHRRYPVGRMVKSQKIPVLRGR